MVKLRQHFCTAIATLWLQTSQHTPTCTRGVWNNCALVQTTSDNTLVLLLQHCGYKPVNTPLHVQRGVWNNCALVQTTSDNTLVLLLQHCGYKPVTTPLHVQGVYEITVHSCRQLQTTLLYCYCNIVATNKLTHPYMYNLGVYGITMHSCITTYTCA